MDAAIPLFQQYQLQFTAHVRNPLQHARPAHVPAKRMQVYNEIVFNNLLSAVSACFPVTQSVLGKKAWQKLVREFFAQHQCHSPLFRQIPEEFLRYLETLDAAALAVLPRYLKSLAHYEWVELALAVADVDLDMTGVDIAGDLLEGQPVLVPAVALLNYDYPVQRISKRNQPDAPESVHLLVFRNMQDEVRFIELNAITARLLSLLQTEAMTGRQALQKLAIEMAHPAPQTLVEFGRNLLEELKQEGAILGVAA